MRIGGKVVHNTVAVVGFTSFWCSGAALAYGSHFLPCSRFHDMRYRRSNTSEAIMASLLFPPFGYAVFVVRGGGALSRALHRALFGEES